MSNFDDLVTTIANRPKLFQSHARLLEILQDEKSFQPSLDPLVEMAALVFLDLNSCLTKETVQACVGHPSPTEIAFLIRWLSEAKLCDETNLQTILGMKEKDLFRLVGQIRETGESAAAVFGGKLSHSADNSKFSCRLAAVRPMAATEASDELHEDEPNHHVDCSA